MRTIWVVRHCKPESTGVRICLGRRDDPGLCEEGVRTAEALGARLAGHGIERVYASTLARSRETAELLVRGLRAAAGCGSGCAVEGPLVRDSFAEMDMGEWDGMPWSEIRTRYPELYEARGADRSLMPPGAESCEAAAARYERALLATQGNCAVVVHRGAFAALLAKLRGAGHARPRAADIPYGAAFRLVEEDGALCLHPRECDAEGLFRKYATPAQVVAHCRAVAQLADEMACDLRKAGVQLDAGLVHAAALLHDLMRTEHGHAQRGADVLEQEGYPLVAAAVRGHHDAAQQTDPPDEAAVVFLADKLVAGARRVTLEERFACSAAKCTTPEARAKHAALYRTSLLLNEAMGAGASASSGLPVYDAVVTAAGLSSRMGAFKPLLDLGGMRVIDRTIASLRGAGVRRVCVVAGRRAQDIREHLAASQPVGVFTVENPRFAHSHMFDSILIGLRALLDPAEGAPAAPAPDGIFVTPVDIPLVRAETVRRIAQTPGAVVSPAHDGKTGHPVLIRRAALPAVLSHDGSCGLRGAFERLPEQPVRADVDDEAILLDADTPEDFARLQALLYARTQ